jgi:S-disulfanyl-L-cysteine oxidoreductase SoxD
MSSSRERLNLVVAATLALLSGAALAQSAMPGIGRPATPKEIAAWDIDVRPDFKGLPKGSGSVAQGQDIWEGKCSQCHGVFGESNEVFSPLVGGTTAEDIKTGRVAKLNDTSFPGRTTLMKVATVSTLWDYINRAMPWTAPKSLKTDEVYAVTAYLLNMGGVVPDNYVMSDKNIAEVQARMPNRNGMTLDHGLWPGKAMKTAGKPDVKAVACMTNCEAEPKVGSFLPEHARNNHGNLAEQNRMVGAQHGADTTRPAGSAVLAPVAPAPVKAESGPTAASLLQKYSCTACHAVDSKLVGPAFREIARKYGSQADGVAYLAGKIKSGGSGVWGQIPMPPQTLSDTEARMIGQWLIDGAKN